VHDIHGVVGVNDQGSATGLNEYVPTASLKFHQGTIETCILGVVLHMLVDCLIFKGVAVVVHTPCLLHRI
jgi:hypothetical protein